MKNLLVIIVEDSQRLSAVFPTLLWSSPETITCFDFISGHGAGTKEWYKKVKIAKKYKRKRNIPSTST